jgi:hypothetical protein
MVDNLKVKTADEIRNQLDFLQNKLDCCLVIDGDSLQVSFVDIQTYEVAHDSTALPDPIQERIH